MSVIPIFVTFSAVVLVWKTHLFVMGQSFLCNYVAITKPQLTESKITPIFFCGGSREIMYALAIQSISLIVGNILCHGIETDMHNRHNVVMCIFKSLEHKLGPHCDF